MSTPHPPYRILTPRLLLRCYHPTDAFALQAVAAENRDHLVRWVAWAHREPQTVDQKVQRIRGLRAQFDLGRAFTYGAFSLDGDRLLGEGALSRDCGPAGMTLGYWLDHHCLGRGLATEMTQGLARVGLQVLDKQWVEIHCPLNNPRSAAIPARIGFTHCGTVRRAHPWSTDRVRELAIWRLTAEDLPQSTAAHLPLRFFDAADREMPLDDISTEEQITRQR